MSAARALLIAALLVLVAIATAHAQAAPSPAGPRVHVVQRGDTLSSIAKRHGVRVASLVRANGLPAKSARLKVGTRLTIPADGAAGEPPRSLAASRSASPAATRAKGTTAPTRVRRAALTGGLAVPSNLVLAVPDFAVTAPAFLWPIEGWVSSSFGRRRRGWHRGVDIMAPSGTTIIASAGGLVVASGWEVRYGRVVKIAHEDGFTTVYAHNDTNLVEVAEWVVAGQPIGTVGRTGRATGDHVHFEIRQDGLAYNPLYLLPEPPRIASVQPDSDISEDDEDE